MRLVFSAEYISKAESGKKLALRRREKRKVNRQLGVDMVDEPWPWICVVDVCCEGRRYRINSNVGNELVTL